MRQLSPLAGLLVLALTLGVFSVVMIAAPVHARSHAYAKGKSEKARGVGHSAQPSSKSGKLKPVTRSRSQARRQAGLRRPRIHRALSGGQTRLRKGKTWPTSVEHIHLAMPAPLRGSHESLVHQNEMAEADGLERILDDADLGDRIAHGSLVPVPVSNSLRINPDLPENRRYCRPWTAKFLIDLARAHSTNFGGGALEVTSAVRTVEYQRQLRTVNGNAAAADGDIASPHLTGGTIDLAKQGLTSREIGWLRAWLIPLEQSGKIDVEEEFRQSCFHISVYKSYMETKTSPKPAPLASGSMLAASGR